MPDNYRYGAVGLGAGIWYTIRTILFPLAMPGIITGIILSIGLIVGEPAVLIFTAGSEKGFPKSISALFKKIFESGGTLTTQLHLSSISEGDFETTFGIATVLDLSVVSDINTVKEYAYQPTVIEIL